MNLHNLREILTISLLSDLIGKSYGIHIPVTLNHYAAIVVQGLIIAGDLEILLIAASGVLLTLLIIKLAWRRKADPKMALFLSLTEGLAREMKDTDSVTASEEDQVFGEEHGPLGPGGFTLNS